MAVSGLKFYKGAIPANEKAVRTYKRIQISVEFLTANGTLLAGFFASEDSVVIKSKPK